MGDELSRKGMLAYIMRLRKLKHPTDYRFIRVAWKKDHSANGSTIGFMNIFVQTLKNHDLAIESSNWLDDGTRNNLPVEIQLGKWVNANLPLDSYLVEY